MEAGHDDCQDLNLFLQRGTHFQVNQVLVFRSVVVFLILVPSSVCKCLSIYNLLGSGVTLTTFGPQKQMEKWVSDLRAKKYG